MIVEEVVKSMGATAAVIDDDDDDDSLSLLLLLSFVLGRVAGSE